MEPGFFAALKNDTDPCAGTSRSNLLNSDCAAFYFRNGAARDNGARPLTLGASVTPAVAPAIA